MCMEAATNTQDCYAGDQAALLQQHKVAEQKLEGLLETMPTVTSVLRCQLYLQDRMTDHNQC